MSAFWGLFILFVWVWGAVDLIRRTTRWARAGTAVRRQWLEEPCSRCALSGPNRLFVECGTCGPVALCRNCGALHLAELAEGVHPWNI